MATLKKTETGNLFDSIQRVHDEIESYPIVGERYYVAEHWPTRRAAWNDEYNDWLPARTTKCSIDYKTKAEAESFIEKHNPAKGASFIIKHQYLRERPVREWWDAHERPANAHKDNE